MSLRGSYTLPVRTSLVPFLGSALRLPRDAAVRPSRTVRSQPHADGLLLLRGATTFSTPIMSPHMDSLWLSVMLGLPFHPSGVVRYIF